MVRWLMLLFAGLAWAEEAVIVVHKMADSVGIYSTKTAERIANIDVGLKPHEVVLTPDEKTAYVTNYGVDTYTEMTPGGNTISIIDLTARKRVGDIDLGAFRRPHGIEMGESGRLYVTTDFPAAVLIVDPAARKVLKSFPLEETLPHMIAVTRDEKRAFVACSGSGSVAILDLETGASKAVEIGGVPMGIRLSPDEKRVWATNRTGEAIVAIDAATGGIFNRHPMMGQPVRLALSPDKRRVVVTFIGSGDGAVLDAITMQPERRFPIGKRAEGLGYDPTGKFVYVTAQGEDKMLKVSTSTWKPVLEFKTGAKPDTPVVFQLK